MIRVQGCSKLNRIRILSFGKPNPDPDARFLWIRDTGTKRGGIEEKMVQFCTKTFIQLTLKRFTAFLHNTTFCMCHLYVLNIEHHIYLFVRIYIYNWIKVFHFKGILSQMLRVVGLYKCINFWQKFWVCV